MNGRKQRIDQNSRKAPVSVSERMDLKKVCCKPRCMLDSIMERPFVDVTCIEICGRLSENALALLHPHGIILVQNTFLRRFLRLISSATVAICMLVDEFQRASVGDVKKAPNGGTDSRSWHVQLVAIAGPRIDDA
jgi:hypothetical protein